MTDPWAVYQPDAAGPWTLAGAWTLRRRAGFGATWRELGRDRLDGPQTAVDRLLAGEARLDGQRPDFAATADLLGDSAAAAGDIRRLQAWAIFRALATPDPLTERLALVWHDGFATSQAKVRDVAAMHGQARTFRALGLGPYEHLLRAMLADPALLIYLDAPMNRRGKPNENLARELLELFTLGVGHFDEADVKGVARALTGRSVVRGRYESRAEHHDDGPETILGLTDRFDGEKLVDLLLRQPSLADRLAARLARALLGEGVADRSALAALADRLRADGLHVGRGVATILRSRLFHAPSNQHSRISDPPGVVVGAARALERFEPLPSTLLLAEWTTRLGLDLFFPPNVGGWPGGRAWLAGRSAVARANFAAGLVGDGLAGGGTGAAPDLPALARLRFGADDPADALLGFARLLLGRELPPDRVERPGGPGDLGPAVARLLARPEAQLD